MSLVKNWHAREIDPPQLQAQLALRGYAASLRTLRSLRKNGSLPRLKARGRGRGRGKRQFWDSPLVIEQAAACCELRKLKYPNDEARLVLWLLGFPIHPAFIRNAWRSRLGKIELDLQSKKTAAITKLGGPFFETEDELSALITKYIPIFANRFGVDRDAITTPTIDLFGLVFSQGFIPDEILQHDLLGLLETKIAKPISEHAIFSDQQFISNMNFLQTYMSFAAVNEIVLSATDFELVRSHRYWRRILGFSRQLLPVAIFDNQAGKLLASRFGKICVPTILRLVREGKSVEVELSIREIAKFTAQHEGIIFRFAAVVMGGKLSQSEKLDLASLTQKLAKIWGHAGIPFSP